MERPEDRLALIELTERDGQPARLVDVQAWPVTLGRAIDNTVVLDDPHVAAHHARLDLAPDGRVQLQVLSTRNGVLVAGQPADATRMQPLPAGGALLQIGATRVRLRLPDEELAPELALPTRTRVQHGWAWMAGAGFAALEFGEHALRLDPGAGLAAWLPTLIGVPVAVVSWCGVWALLSKLFRHRFDFSGHLYIALPWLLVLSLLDSLWPQVAASLAWPGMWQLSMPLQALGAALLVRAHLLHTLPAHPRMVSATVAGLTVLAGGLSLVGSWRAMDSLKSAPYMSTLPLPAVRLAGTVPSVQLVQAMQPLAARLAQRARKPGEEDTDDSSSNAED